MPPAVQKTIGVQNPGTLVKIDSKVKKDGTRYKVVMMGKNGMQRRLVLDSSGKVLKLKNDVAAEAMPAAVQKTVKAQTQGAKFVRSTQVTKDEKVTYEVELDVDGRQKVLLLEPTGPLLKVESEVSRK